jgi:hypothetical protein
MQLLSKHDNEQLVIQLYQDGKTIRDIEPAVHMSFGDIGKFFKRLDGQNNDVIHTSNKSKATQALFFINRARSRLM